MRANFQLRLSVDGAIPPAASSRGNDVLLMKYLSLASDRSPFA
jgi:hypothetical protein